MSWLKLDDQWMEHPKIIRAGRDGRDLWLASLTWCAKYLTDGHFPRELLPTLAVMAGVDVANCQTFATTLLDVGLWDATIDGFCVHDYLDYNPTKEAALATRNARSEAGKRGGEARSANFKQNPKQTPSKTLANSKQNPAPSPSPSPSPSHINGGGGGGIGAPENFGAFAKIYEGEIGSLTPMIRDELTELESEYSLEWFQEAVKVAVDNNARKLKYVRTILERWKIQGFKSPMIVSKKFPGGSGIGQNEPASYAAIRQVAAEEGTDVAF